MKVRVESVFLERGAQWIEFSCELGRGEAEWRVGTPQFGSEYHVELELSPPIEISVALVRVPLLDATRHNVQARGVVEQTLDGAAVVRLGNSPSAPSLMIEAVQLPAGRWVALRSGPLQLFDENL